VAEHFAQCLVCRGYWVLQAVAAPKRRIDRVERRSDIRAAMVVAEKMTFAVREVVQHVIPRLGLLAARIYRHVGRRVHLEQIGHSPGPGFR